MLQLPTQALKMDFDTIILGGVCKQLSYKKQGIIIIIFATVFRDLEFGLPARGKAPGKAVVLLSLAAY